MSATITSYIKQDLKARLRSEPAEILTLAALAKRYHVSQTPVRLAVRDLVAEQFLSKQPNGRLTLNRDNVQDKRASVSPPVLPPDLRDLENEVTGAVIRLSLLGNAEHLREEATARQFGIGRTVLRQVFNRLAGKGLLEHLPRRGWRLRPFDEADLQAYLDVRVSLELKALELARPHLVRADLQAMLHGNTPAMGAQPRLDNQLHRYFIDKSGNPYIRDFFDRHGLYFTTLFEFAAPAARVVAAMAKQHRGILRALLARQWSTARQALEQHIRAQRPVLQQLLQRLGRTGSHPEKNP